MFIIGDTPDISSSDNCSVSSSSCFCGCKINLRLADELILKHKFREKTFLKAKRTLTHRLGSRLESCLFGVFVTASSFLTGVFRQISSKLDLVNTNPSSGPVNFTRLDPDSLKVSRDGFGRLNSRGFDSGVSPRFLGIGGSGRFLLAGKTVSSISAYSRPVSNETWGSPVRRVLVEETSLGIEISGIRDPCVNRLVSFVGFGSLLYIYQERSTPTANVMLEIDKVMTKCST